MNLYIILVICLIPSTMAVVPACPGSSYCKACSTSTATHCTLCFNWKLGMIGPRYLSGNKCLNAQTAIPYCKVYCPNATTAMTGADSCEQCDNGSLVLEVTSAGVTSVVCNLLPPGCSALADCEQQKCASSDGGHNFTATCLLCKSSKGASAANACAGTIIANCDNARWVAGAQHCAYPKSGYAVESTGLTSVAYTADSNCQQLAAGSDTQCQSCWDGYYWNTSVCKLSGKLLGAAFLAAVGFFVY